MEIKGDEFIASAPLSLLHLLRKGFPDKTVGKSFGRPPRYTVRWTNRVTGRGLCVLQTLDTEIALRGGILVIIKLHGPEWTGLQALFTTDADCFID